jgi:hypothetical protein
MAGQGAGGGGLLVLSTQKKGWRGAQVALLADLSAIGRPLMTMSEEMGTVSSTTLTPQPEPAGASADQAFLDQLLGRTDTAATPSAAGSAGCCTPNPLHRSSRAASREMVVAAGSMRGDLLDDLLATVQPTRVEDDLDALLHGDASQHAVRDGDDLPIDLL